MVMPNANKGMNRHLIRVEDFYSCEEEKTKFNWFCYEYALELEHTINEGLRRKLQEKGITEIDIAYFCTHYAKHMKGAILERLFGKTRGVNISYYEIERFFPTIGDKLVDELLTAVAKAWDTQIAACIQCPTRCISEKDYKAPMFDDPYYR